MRGGGGAGIRALHLFALSGFAIAQPLLDLLARYAELFVARRSETADVALLVLWLALAPPAALWGLERLATAASEALGRAVYRAAIAALIALTALPLLHRIGVLPPAASLAAAGALGIGAAWAYTRLAAVRRAATWLAAGPVVFVTAFFLQGSIRALLFDEVRAKTAPLSIKAPAPIQLVVFDELPLASLLDADGEIDALGYPSFARLARTSSWLRNATSVESRTLQAIPAIVSGRYPAATRRLPLASQHPVTLFSLLAPTYTMRVAESLTILHKTEEPVRAPIAERLTGLVRDVALIYAHVVLPPKWSQTMPSVRQTWRDFAAGRTDPRRSAHALRGRPTQFRRFVMAIRPSAEPSLHFIHIVLPHGPWQYTPSGASFHPFRNFGRFLGYWSEEEYFTIEAYQRHLMQVALADRLLGELLDHLETIGLFDPSLLVVLADHGASFWPGDHFRDFESGAHPADILSVPLFVKRPHQTQPEVSVKNVETIDVLPTILDVIGAEIPPETDGCSVFDTGCPERGEKIAFSAGGPGSSSNQTHHFPADLGLSQDGLRRKLALFGSGAPAVGLYRFGEYAALVGQPLSALRVDEGSAGRALLEGAQRTWQLGRDELLVPARVVGVLELVAAPGGTPHVAIAVNGTIESVVPAPAEGANRWRIAAMLPERSLRETGNRIELYLVAGSAVAPRLRALDSRTR